MQEPLGEAISEMSYRVVGGPSKDGTHAMGVTIQEFSHAVIVREYRVPREGVQMLLPQKLFSKSMPWRARRSMFGVGGRSIPYR